MSGDADTDIGGAQLVILLHLVPYVGEKSLARLLRANARRRGTPAEWLSGGPNRWIREHDIDPRAADYLHDNRSALIAQSAEIARLARCGMLHVLTLQSAAYPARLDQNADVPPPIVYAIGDLSLMGPPSDRRFTFTIAASNGVPAAALARLDALGTELVKAGGVPVTGHDRAPYQRLALSAQRRNASSIFVLDRGIREAMGPDLDRPLFAAARIRDAHFARERDVVVSPFRMDDHGIGENNRRRDQLVFALADVVIGLDVREQGAMLEGCLRVREQGRPVFVAEGGRPGNERLRRLECSPLPSEPQEAAALVAKAVCIP